MPFIQCNPINRLMFFFFLESQTFSTNIHSTHRPQCSRMSLHFLFYVFWLQERLYKNINTLAHAETLYIMKSLHPSPAFWIVSSYIGLISPFTHGSCLLGMKCLPVKNLSKMPWMEITYSDTWCFTRWEKKERIQLLHPLALFRLIISKTHKKKNPNSKIFFYEC